MRATAPDPAWTLVRLKLRLIANRAKSSRQGVVQLIVSIVFALLGGGFGAFVFGSLVADSDLRVSRSTAVLGACALTVGWALLPLLSSGTDESLDPERLVLFPLRRPTLMRGLLGGSLVGPAPFAVIIVCAGAAAGFVLQGGWVAIPAIVVLVLFSAVTARALSATLASGLSSRRGRDAMIIVASVFFLAAQGLRFVRWTSIGPGTFDRIGAVARWTPPGMLGQAAFESRQGHQILAVALDRAGGGPDPGADVVVVRRPRSVGDAASTTARPGRPADGAPPTCRSSSGACRSSRPPPGAPSPPRSSATSAVSLGGRSTWSTA